MTSPAEERDEIVRIAESVIAGKDGIEVPVAMVSETNDATAAGAPPAADEQRVLGLHAQIRAMPVPQRVKLAMKGNRESRSILLRDSNRMIPRMVLLNPRITEDEIVILAKDRNSDVEILRQIGENRDWVTHYGIRAALVENARTPVDLSLRLLTTLQEREIRALAKSKNVSSAVATQARRMLFIRAQGGRSSGR